MCGIIGIAGKRQAVPVLLDGLEKLEYRGYDSAGVAVISDDGTLRVEKCKGRIAVLREKTGEGAPITGTTGIGHTRWATHGEPSDINAHPQMGQEGIVAVVHNGIIENYRELKQSLERSGRVFKSETDTEVVAQLMEYYYDMYHDLMDAVYAMLSRIRGSYALGILSADAPGQIIAARKDAPLLIGYGEGENFIASDVTALLSHTRTVSYLDDDEVAVITPESVCVYDAGRLPVTKEQHTVEWDVSSAEKGGYAHFMLKEIMEQPEAVRRTFSPRLQDKRIEFEELADFPDLIKKISRVYLVGCGSAYHVGVVGKYMMEKLLRIPAEAVLASEFRYCDPIVGPDTLVIVISQSGETLDSMAALREAKRRGATVLAVVNVIGSSIAREADIVLYTWAGPEIAVATTKAYSTQLVLLSMLTVYFSDKLGKISSEDYGRYVDDLSELPGKMEDTLSEIGHIQKTASLSFNHDSVFFIGRNLDYALGLEGSLKLKEISYIHSESYAAGELKHGTISLMEPGVLVVTLATCSSLIEKTWSNMVEVTTRGADVLALTTQDNTSRFREQSSAILPVPSTNELLQMNLNIIPLQLFAYYVALNRGCDIDKPRNLAKSVTVE
ncbi:MAG: glutamine--fructose-6-phosphate transaminase (isomerizing) [Eubacteriaceae bacterium]|nr:glutamine--fructose-6-phosphate transaminase (isomerizing) [Eubacteriaceae bacterium]